MLYLKMLILTAAHNTRLAIRRYTQVGDNASRRPPINISLLDICAAGAKQRSTPTPGFPVPLSVVMGAATVENTVPQSGIRQDAAITL
jgi:hypothetical protein